MIWLPAYYEVDAKAVERTDRDAAHEGRTGDSLGRRVLRTVRDATAALSAGVLLGAIGWGMLEGKTRSYWTNW